MIVAKAYPANRKLSNVFDEFFNSFPATWGNEVKSNTSAQVNISESDNGYTLDFNVPGRNKEDFKINVDKGLLTISYEKKDEADKEAKFIRREFSFQNFQRSFTLDEKVNPEGIEAKYENGILKVFVPKKEEVKIAPKQISIQ